MCVTSILPGGDYIHTVFLLSRALESMQSLKNAYKKASQPHGLIKVLTWMRSCLMSEMTDGSMLTEAFRPEGQPSFKHVNNSHRSPPPTTNAIF